MKKAQQLTIQTLIVAILLIVAVIVLLALLLRGGEIFSKGTSSCEAQEGKCVGSTVECLEKGGRQIQFECPKNKVCCQL